MPVGWRITKAARAAKAFDGEGARLHGGRWNSPGTPMVYTAESRSLAALEMLVHLQSSRLLASYVAIPATFDDRLVEIVEPATLPSRWSAYPPPVALRELGDRWVAASRSVVLQVPSAVVATERLFLFNPRHADFGRVTIGAAARFEFDRRLK
jgi:RES domain-containing protein